jgi:hypothetical protein
MSVMIMQKNHVYQSLLILIHINGEHSHNIYRLSEGLLLAFFTAMCSLQFRRTAKIYLVFTATSMFLSQEIMVQQNK